LARDILKLCLKQSLNIRIDYTGLRISVTDFNIHLVDTLVCVILFELVNLPIRVRESSRDISPSVPNVCLNNDHVVEPELLFTHAQLFHVLRHRPVLGLRSCLGLRRIIICRVLIYIAYVARTRADLYSIGIDYVIIYDVRALRCKKNWFIEEIPIISRIYNCIQLKSVEM